MAIKQYSLKKDGVKQLSPAFRVREFRCRDGTDTILIDEGLVVLLQCIREHFGKPVTITSGYRTASHNTKVGGSKSSQHLLGRAADIQVQNTDPLAVAAYAESLMPGWGGVGRYPKSRRTRRARPAGCTWTPARTRAGGHCEVNNMSKTIFISQPMGGLSDEQVLQERAAAISKAKALLGEDVALLETFFDDFGPAAKPLDYLARSIEFLAKADVAIFAPGWKDARGCRIEHQCAEDYGIPVMEV